MKVFFISLSLALCGFAVSAQQKCQTEELSERIDSICKANNLNYCEVYFYWNHDSGISDMKRQSGKFRLDDCFLIINENHWYDLSKLIDFNVYVNPKEPEKRVLYVKFQQ